MPHTSERLLTRPPPAVSAAGPLAPRVDRPPARMPEPAAASRYRGDTYYGRPALKPSPFGWTVAFYIFEGGLAGAAQIIATVADCFGPPEARALVRRGRYIAFLGAAAGAGLLIVELHKPARFFNMLRIFRATSPMSIGSYVLTSFGAFSGLAALGQLVEDRGRSRGWPRWLARISQLPAALAGAGMTTYTAALLASTSTPLLAAEPQLLAIRFASSSVASGAAALSLAGRLGSGERDNPALDTLATAAAGVELAASLASEARYRAAGVAGPLQKAPWGPSQKLGVVVAGTLAPIGLYALSRARGRRSPGLSIAASLALLAGSFAMRAIMLQAGNESAMRPRDYFRFAQPGRTPQRQALEGQPG